MALVGVSKEFCWSSRGGGRTFMYVDNVHSVAGKPNDMKRNKVGYLL